MSSSPLVSFSSNRLLERLSPPTMERLRTRMTRVALPLLSKRLLSSGQSQDAVYFPLDALTILSHTDEQRRTGGVAIAGCDAVIGAGAFLGSRVCVHDVSVVMEGEALCMARDAVLEQFAADAQFRALMLRYAHALLTQISFTAFCERTHAIEQRLIRWLLLASERTPHDGLTLSQETLARVLSVRREGVTLAAGKLQRSGLIRYQRSRIVIVDVPGMKALACQCYREIRAEYARLFSQT